MDSPESELTFLRRSHRKKNARPLLTLVEEMKRRFLRTQNLNWNSQKKYSLPQKNVVEYSRVP